MEISHIEATKFLTSDGLLNGHTYFDVNITFEDGSSLPYTFLDSEENNSEIDNLIRSGLNDGSIKLPTEFPSSNQVSADGSNIVERLSEIYSFEKVKENKISELKDCMQYRLNHDYTICNENIFSVDLDTLNAVTAQIQSCSEKNCACKVLDVNGEFVVCSLSELTIIRDNIIRQRLNLRNHFTKLLERAELATTEEELDNIEIQDEFNNEVAVYPGDISITESNNAIEILKESKIKEIDEFISIREKEDYVVVDEHSFSATAENLAIVNSLISSCTEYNKIGKLLDINNCWVDLSVEELKLVRDYITKHRENIRSYYTGLKHKVYECNTIEELDDLNIVDCDYTDILIDGKKGSKTEESLCNLKTRLVKKYKQLQQDELSEIEVQIEIDDPDNQDNKISHSFIGSSEFLNMINAYIIMQNSDVISVSDANGEIVDLNLDNLKTLQKLIAEEINTIILKYSYFFNVISEADTAESLNYFE
jgi:hypothetical protein